VTTFTCPKGHESTADDYCDTCGAKIGGALSTAVMPPVTPSSTASPSSTGTPAGDPCPNCGFPRAGAGRFCEDCGFDHSTGKVPTLAQPAVAAPAATGQWTATIFADRTYFDANAIEGVEFPVDTTQREVYLPAPQVRIGRKSSSKGTDPEIDLSAAPLDPGVSHSHALLTLSVDGVWLVSDLGSTNGTYLNDEAKPLTAGQTRSVGDGDRVHVGAWTTIALHGPSAG
jgi:FHA domain-containing protein